MSQFQRVHNGQSWFDLFEMSTTLRPDIAFKGSREILSNLVTVASIVCPETGERIVPHLYQRPLAKGTMLKRGAIVKNWKVRHTSFEFR